MKVDNRLSDPIADIDPDQMVQVLTNLYTNAQQAMPDGGTLTIDLSDDPETVTIKVTDTGVGIPEENMPKLFDPFFTTKQVGMGTGLGPGRDPRHRQDAQGADRGRVQRRPGRRPHRHHLHRHPAAARIGARGAR